MSTEAARTVVVFRSDAFNQTKPGKHFINECCFGDDLCAWLMQALRERGVSVKGEAEQEDFGWFFTFEVAGIEHDLVVTSRPSDGDIDADWVGWIARRAGLLSSMFGGRKRGIRAEAVRAIHEALSTSLVIREVRWFDRRAFDRRDESGGASLP